MLRVGFLKARVVEMATRLRASQVPLRVPAIKLRLFPDFATVRTVAILVPHPDDEVIGCYHLINEIGKSVAIDLYYVTDGVAGGVQESFSLSDHRIAESGYATAGLPIRNRQYWHFPDGKLGRLRDELCKHLGMLGEYDLVLCPSPTDLTPDHAALADAALLAVNLDILLWYRSTWLTFPLSASDFSICGDALQKSRAMRCFISQGDLALGNTITLSGVEAKLSGLEASSVEAFRFAASGCLEWQPVNVLSLGAIERLKEWY